MDTFPVSEVSGAISHIVSSVVPPRAYIFMVALLPGAFFGIAVLLTDPPAFCDLVARAHDGLGLGHYEVLVLFLLLAFVIGNAFILFVTLIQRLLGYLYRFRTWMWEWICIWPLSPLVIWLGRKPFIGRRQRFRDFSDHLQLSASGVPVDEGVRRLWARIARTLLKQKYGIDPSDLGQAEWNALFWSLGSLTITDIRGSMTMVVFEATGWCGLAAALLADSLRNRYYLGLSVLLTVAGLLHDWYVAGNLNNRAFLGLLRVRALLREFPKVVPPPGVEKKSALENGEI